MVLAAMLAAVALGQAAPSEPPPAVLAPYIRKGRFDPGDYGWMRGRFDDATPEQKAESAAIHAWLERCHVRGLAQSRTELAALGVREAKLDRVASRHLLCNAVATTPYQIDTRSFASFERDVAVARPIAESFLFAVDLAEEAGRPRNENLTTRLIARTQSEQMLRGAMNWREASAAGAPSLSPGVKAIVMSRIWIAATERDAANTAWLKDVVEKEGWPGLSKVGEAASREAWLLVQHADADPPFQLKALRLMEPLLAKGDVSKRDYAYLYDRVMLKIVGTQRYGTQAECKGGKRVPQPLDGSGAVDTLRKSVDLEPIAAYLASMDKNYGACPAE